MKAKLLFFLVFFSISFLSRAQSKDEQQIRRLLATQTESWNRGDIEGFMQTYWKSDSLMFIGKSGVNWGWQQTLNNYKKSYPDTAAMGKLSFDILQVKKLSDEYYYVVGKWMLQRTIGDLSGHYDLLLRKIKGNWVIVADHSS
ncbi:MAG: YybH family protein [Flavisolibacter sp.]